MTEVVLEICGREWTIIGKKRGVRLPSQLHHFPVGLCVRGSRWRWFYYQLQWKNVWLVVCTAQVVLRKRAHGVSGGRRVSPWGADTCSLEGVGWYTRDRKISLSIFQYRLRLCCVCGVIGLCKKPQRPTWGRRFGLYLVERELIF